MKKVFTDWQENEPSCDPDVYLKKYVKRMEKKGREERKILCPNCTKDRLVRQADKGLQCETCGYEFVQINTKTIRYK